MSPCGLIVGGVVAAVISTFKCVFGASVRALLSHTAYVEISTKITTYNHSLNVGDRDVQAAAA